jgi:hypothetical protein
VWFSAPSDAPKNFIVRAINSTSVNITWSLPGVGSRNAIIRGFKIFYSKIGSSSVARGFEVKNGLIFRIVLNGLEKFSKYSFNILAYTTSDRPQSAAVVTTTLEDGRTIW